MKSSWLPRSQNAPGLSAECLGFGYCLTNTFVRMLPCFTGNQPLTAFQVLNHPLLLPWHKQDQSPNSPVPERSCNRVELLARATPCLPPPGAAGNVQPVSSLSDLCVLDCFPELQVVLGSKSCVFYIVKKWWLKVVLVPKCVGSKFQVCQKLMLSHFWDIFEWFWDGFDQTKIFLMWRGTWPFTVQAVTDFRATQRSPSPCVASAASPAVCLQRELAAVTHTTDLALPRLPRAEESLQRAGRRALDASERGHECGFLPKGGAAKHCRQHLERDWWAADKTSGWGEEDVKLGGCVKLCLREAQSQ